MGLPPFCTPGPYGHSTKTIEVFELTKRMTTCWGTEGSKAEAKELARNSCLEPHLTVECSGLRTADVFQECGGGHVATMEAPLLPSGTARLTFRSESPHPSQELRVRPVRLVDVNEWFVKDNVVYVWEMRPRHHGRGYSLYRCF